MKRIFFLFLLCRLSYLFADSEPNSLVEDFNEVGNTLFYLLISDDNPLLSPFSLNSSLLMTYLGAKGTTRLQMKGALGYTLPDPKLGSIYAKLFTPLRSELHLANGMWVDNSTIILPSYTNLIEKDFSGIVKKLSFTHSNEATSTINDWVEKNTEGQITDFLPLGLLSENTKLVLTSALFYKGKWEKPFETKKTAAKSFHLASGDIEMVPMMSQEGNFSYFENTETQLLVLPLEASASDSSLALLVYLPKQNIKHNVFNYYYKLEEGQKGRYLSYLDKVEEKTVAVTLPKFTFNQKRNLNTLLKEMGIENAFTPGANFSGITGKEDLHISDLIHQSLFSIDEGGVLAVGVSGVVFGLKSAPPQGSPVAFEADHPFFYLLVDLDTKLILFMGTCDNPVTTSGKK